jgi:hypothetical protein
MNSAAENSNKFQKTRFWKEKSVEDEVNTSRLTIQFKHDFLSYLAIQKINTYIAKLCSHVEFPYFVMGSHLGQWHKPHKYKINRPLMRIFICFLTPWLHST